MLKKTLPLILILLICILMAGCVEDQTLQYFTLSELGLAGALDDQTSTYQIFEYDFLDIQTIAIKRTVLQERLDLKNELALRIQGIQYPLVVNPIKTDQYIANIPAEHTRNEIRQTIIQTIDPATGQNRLEQSGTRSSITIASLIIEKTGEQCDSDLYRIERNLFTQMRSAGIFVFNTAGEFIIPTYTESSQEKDYLLSDFIQARSAVGGSVHEAFSLLEQHSKAVDIQTNQVTVENGEIVIICASAACDGVLLKNLGNEGDLSQSGNVYQILDNRGTAAVWNVDIRQSRLPAAFKNAEGWKLILGEKEYTFVQNIFNVDIYGIEIPESDTSNINDIRNACFVKEGGEQTYTLTLNRNNTGWGSVSGSGNYEVGEQVSISATANSGYRFVNWTKSGVLISTSANYSYTMPSENVTLVANFEAGSSSNTPETVLVHGGTFQMGDTRDEGNNVHGREKPVHTVNLTYDFLIGKYEVTFDQFDAYCEAAGINKPSDAEWGRGQRPVINVNWRQAIAYCNWLSEQEGLQPAYDSNHFGYLLDKNGEVTTDITQVEGYRLPTEAEWEYAARGGHEDITNGVEANDYKYAGSNTVDEVAWYQYTSSTTQEVGQKLPNELGLYDMSGNVWEWCHDQFEDYSAGTHTNPIGVGSTYRIKRGGSWYGHGVYAVDMFCRVAYRGYSDSYGSHMGFRIAKTVVGHDIN